MKHTPNFFYLSSLIFLVTFTTANGQNDSISNPYLISSVPERSSTYEFNCEFDFYLLDDDFIGKSNKIQKNGDKIYIPINGTTIIYHFDLNDIVVRANKMGNFVSIRFYDDVRLVRFDLFYGETCSCKSDHKSLKKLKKAIKPLSSY